MIREFFASGTGWRRAFAWSGLLVFVGHSLFKAWLKWAINQWYAEFYDALQDISWEPGSGQTDRDVGLHMAGKQAEVGALLARFALLVSPAIVVHPIAKWISSTWRFTWRMSLVRAYLLHYDVGQRPVEGAAQRIHEDTQRFEVGIYSCFSTLLDSLLTLIIFIPVLLDVGAGARPTGFLDYDGWLVSIAVCAAVGGLCVSMAVGYKLVRLEVQNQKVEAMLRTKLVMLEQTPTLVVGAERPGLDTEDDTVDPDDEFTEVSPRPPRARRIAPAPFFRFTQMELWRNYRNLFANFAVFNTWISFYDQVMVIVPYALAAPMMFAVDPTRRITLGTLMQVSNSFDKVFGAMAVVSENWSSVNEFRSTVYRLGEFERHTYKRRRFDHTLLRDFDLTATHEVSDIPRLAEGDAASDAAIAIELAEHKSTDRPVTNGECTRVESGRLGA
tara:strand:- start:480 stop:1808 length:1329 start_codon:yes stop_codon:yes gene_type:complete